MTFEQLLQSYIAHPNQMRTGAGAMAKRAHLTVEEVIAARQLARETLDGTDGKPDHASPKILIFDVETAPMATYVWRLWKQTIPWDHVESQWFMLCWSAKWLYSTEVISDKLTPIEARDQDDGRIVEHLWELINEADVVVAYNGKKADIPWMNTRFIVNGLMPPKPYFIVDPYEVMRKKFGFSSNKLDAIAGYFGIEHKMSTDFNLWRGCMEGDPEALKYMSEYNVKDTEILEEAYLRLRPWITNHPNVGTFYDVNSCPTCGSDSYTKLEGQYYFTPAGKYQLYRCQDCGTVFRDRKNLLENRQFRSICR